MKKLLLKPWDLTDVERDRVIRELQTMPTTRGDIALSLLPALVGFLPFFGVLAVSRWLGPSLRSYAVLAVALLPLMLVSEILLGVRLGRRRVPRAIRRVWEGGTPPCCSACGYRLANLGESAEMCPECGEPARSSS